MKNLFYILAIFCSFNITAQKQATYWYFGQGSGLRFNTNPPTVIHDGKLFTYEGCATISNRKGELLFYTDGVTVYNKLHQPMLNGTELLGDPSSSQSAIIVPKPDDENIYYIFTVGFEFPGFRYSTVDMTLDNGNGDVISTEKNINLLSNASEKITAVKHLDGESIWVIAFDGGSFHAFKISTLGVDKSSIRSPLGEFIQDPRGYLKSSPNGEYLAMANHSSSSFLLSFFSGSGKVFPGVRIEFPDVAENAYGIEFSPESNKLYVDTFIEEQTDDPEIFKYTRYLHQFDLNSPDFNNSRILIETNPDTYRGALQLAIDGKIYRALSESYLVGSNYLGVINKPESDGALCNYVHNAINLSPNFKLNLSTQGLPPFIQSLFFFTINVKNACENKEAEFSINTIQDNYTVLWDFGDGSFSTEENPKHQYLSAGVYPVSAVMQLSNGETKSVSKVIRIFEVPQINSGIIIKQCDNDNDGISNFNLNEAKNLLINNPEDFSLEFFESIDDLNNNAQIDISNPFQNISANPQQLWLRATNNIGCSEINNFFVEAINVSLGKMNSYIVCDDSDGIADDSFGLFNFLENEISIRNQFSLDNSVLISYYPSEFDAEFESNRIEGPEMISKAKSIWVRAESSALGCIGIEPMNLVVNELPNPDLKSNYSICINDPDYVLNIEGNPLYNDYEWRNEDLNIIFDTNQSTSINTIGNYSLTSYLNLGGLRCNRTEYFTVNPSNIATIEDIKINDASQNNVITVITIGEGIYQYRLLDENNLIYAPYQDSNVFENVFPGIYAVSIKDIKNDCGTVSDDVSVIGFPKFFTPDNDGYNDTWQVYGVSNMFQPNTKIRIFDRYGKLLKVLNPLGNGWDGLFNGKKLPSDDYWFSVYLQDGRIFKNHFTLKN